MPKELAWIIPIVPGQPDQGLPDDGDRPRPIHPSHPIQLPPLPPGVVAPPIALPPDGGEPANPIVIPIDPTHPIALPPGTVWPPLNPSDGVGGKAILVAWVVGTGKYKWVVVDVPPLVVGTPLPPTPPTPTPK